MKEISELLLIIEKRPLHFLRNKDLVLLDSFLRGYIFAKFEIDSEASNALGSFGKWLNEENTKFNPDWILHFEDNNSQFDLFFKKWNQFVKTTI
ncbi:MAG: hypothetical protein U5M51_02400 [Emticicia sp.]|nr:hypothetical protein [Emticicia sp.]